MLSAAPVPIVFSDGSEYLFAPLNDRDTDTIDQWLQSHFIEVARKSLTATATPQEREETLLLAMREAQKINFLTMDGVESLATLNGMTFICWLSLRKNHPDVTQEQLREKLTNPANMECVNQAFARVNKKPGGNNALKKARAVLKKTRRRRNKKSTER
jgi:hypothetical protein